MSRFSLFFVSVVCLLAAGQSQAMRKTGKGVGPTTASPVAKLRSELFKASCSKAEFEGSLPCKFRKFADSLKGKTPEEQKTMRAEMSATLAARTTEQTKADSATAKAVTTTMFAAFRSDSTKSDSKVCTNLALKRIYGPKVTA